VDQSRVRIEAVLFDLYGTLADIEVDEDADETWAPLVGVLQGLGATARLNDLRTRFYELCTEAAAVHRRGFILTGVFKVLLEEHNAPSTAGAIETFARAFRRASTVNLTRRPYAVSILSRLRTCGLRLGLVSNTEAILTHEDLDRLGLRTFFDAIVLSSEIGVEKPEPEIFQVTLQRLGIAPSSAVMVGDTWQTDVRAAERTGVSAVFLDESLPAGEQARVGDRVIRAYPDEVAILGALRALGVPA
jgi:putative hydrolase of the HAD superfamily